MTIIRICALLQPKEFLLCLRYKKSMILFACISPHPPIILPAIGSKSDRTTVWNTISNLQTLNDKLKKINPDTIVISSPHPDWGFKVPLYFLAKDINPKIEPFLTKEESPADHYCIGKDFYFSELRGKKNKIAVIASGDLSHRLKIDGPYGLHPDGSNFDRSLIEGLRNKDIDNILKLGDMFPKAGECGLRSICFALGILDAARIKWQTNILSYEAPFGVGYLVADLI